MPDENCRKCGGTLGKCTVCSECRSAASWICTQCGTITKERFHTSCFYSDQAFLEKETLGLVDTPMLTKSRCQIC